MAQTTSKGLASSLGKLQISPRSKKSEPAESWEDEANESGSETETETKAPRSPGPVRSTAVEPPTAPPPTPSSPRFADYAIDSPNYNAFPQYRYDGAADEDDRGQARDRAKPGQEGKRPEKTTAVASRLIAAGIGQQAPKRTKEQREYEQAMKVQEKKKRDQAKAEEARKKAEVEKAKKDIWGD